MWSFSWHARRDSNPQPSEPESDALSIEPLALIFICANYYSIGFSESKELFFDKKQFFPQQSPLLRKFLEIPSKKAVSGCFLTFSVV